MGGPFREMFVELSEQAMAAARAAIDKALAPKPEPVVEVARGSFLHLHPRDTLAYLFRQICSLPCEVRHVRDRDAMEIVYRDGCRHTQRISLTSSFLLLRFDREHIGEVIDLIAEKHDERRCYCVRRQEAA